MRINQLRRREFVTLLSGAAVTWPLGARAQQAGKAQRVGMVYRGPEAVAPTRIEAVMNGLRGAGYAEQAQIEFVLRVTGGAPARITRLVAEVVAFKVDVFIAIGLPIVLAARSASQTVVSQHRQHVVERRQSRRSNGGLPLRSNTACAPSGTLSDPRISVCCSR
jgi:hypothetical protein